MADNEVIIELKAKVDSIDKSLKRIEEKSERTGDKVDKELGDGLGKRIGQGFKTGALVATAALAAIGVAAVAAGRRVIEASSRQQDAVNQLNQSLVAAGTFTEEASRGLQEYAAQIERTTTLGDELVLEQLALARTFARSNEEARRLVDAAIELSAAADIELRSAVVNLGKSFSGLTGELGESVAEIRDLTAEQLKAGAAIDLIKGKYDGFAAAQTNTYSGAVAQLSNAYGSLLEAIGDQIIKSPEIVASIKFVQGQIISFTKSIQSASGEGGLRGFINAGLDVARFLTIVLGTAIEGVINIFNSLGTVIGGVAAAIVQLFQGEFSAAADIGKQAISEAFNEDAFEVTGTKAAVGFIEGFRQTINNAPPITKAFEENVGGLSKAAKTSVDQTTLLFRNTLTNGIKTSVSSFGAALAQGENAFAAFGSSALGVLGDFAIELGGFFVATGLGIDALKTSLLVFSGAAAIAAGIALIAIGGALKSFAGGPAAVGDGAESAQSTLAPVGEESLTQLQDTEPQEPNTVVNVNVAGNILDRRETGLELADIINESFSTNGIKIARGVTT